MINKWSYMDWSCVSADVLPLEVMEAGTETSKMLCGIQLRNRPRLWLHVCISSTGIFSKALEYVKFSCLQAFLSLPLFFSTIPWASLEIRSYYWPLAVYTLLLQTTDLLCSVCLFFFTLNMPNYLRVCSTGSSQSPHLSNEFWENKRRTVYQTSVSS